MARTAWHLNRGFPLCTSSSLRSFCLHKERLFHIAHRVQECVRVRMCVCVFSPWVQDGDSHHLYEKEKKVNTVPSHVKWRFESMSYSKSLNFFLNGYKEKTFLQFFLFILDQWNLRNNIIKTLNCIEFVLQLLNIIRALTSSVVLCCGVSKLSSCGILAKRWWMSLATPLLPQGKFHKTLKTLSESAGLRENIIFSFFFLTSVVKCVFV